MIVVMNISKMNESNEQWFHAADEADACSLEVGM